MGTIEICKDPGVWKRTSLDKPRSDRTLQSRSTGTLILSQPLSRLAYCPYLDPKKVNVIIAKDPWEDTSVLYPFVYAITVNGTLHFSPMK
jgi:hypothetical protein